MNRRLFLSTTLLLFFLGSWTLGQGLWIYAKAQVAQYLLKQAWATTLQEHRPTPPWPWADTWPIAQLLVPRLAVDQIVLSGTSGRTLAFGPGHVSESSQPGESGTIIVSGHRDTHFEFLQHLREHDLLQLKSATENHVSYTVQELLVVDSRDTNLRLNPDGETLVLTTCYPFEALIPGGPLRYVVRAEKVPT